MLKLINHKIKLNFDCTIKFVAINVSKQDVIRIYLDKVTSESTVDREWYRR
jgi:hypothetical protein